MARRESWGLAFATMALVGCYTGAGDASDEPNGPTATDSGPGGDDGVDGDETGGSIPVADDYDAHPVALRRLLANQYVESIRLLLGDEAAEAASPPHDAALNGFAAIGASDFALGDNEVERYETSARAIAAAARLNRTSLDPYLLCAPTGVEDQPCMETFVRNFGGLAFRRPLDDIELEQYTDVGLGAAVELSSFEAGLEVTLAAMLQSPLFLYQVEQGEPTQDATIRQLTGPEMATRMAFFLTGATPDRTLLDAAEAGELDTTEGLEHAARELVLSPRARLAFADFSEELLKLGELEATPKDPTLFPSYNTELAAAMAQEPLRLIEHVAFDLDGDFGEIFDADYTFVNEALAAHYGIEGEFGPDFVQAELPSQQRRGGILGHAAVLSAHAHIDRTSPTLRGRFVRETLMCQSIPAPPPGVVTELPEGSDDQTMRERLEDHMNVGSCAGCHILMDGIGFGLERYDAIGAFRTLDNNKPIDDSAELDGDVFAGAAELGTVLRANDAVHTCLVRNLYRHAAGHLETKSENDALLDVSDRYIESGYRLKEALVELVISPAFRVVAPPQ